jgi:hypothetical protein
MDMEQVQRLRSLQEKIASMNFHHREGGQYTYVHFLSLLRELPSLLTGCGPEEIKTIDLMAETFNERLCHRFTIREETYFELSRNKVLRLLVHQLSLEALSPRGNARSVTVQP